MMESCPVCGKRFVVCWPEFWPYRHGKTFFCREACLETQKTREFRERVGWMDDYYRRKKEERKMQRKITLEQKKKAVEIALAGGDQLAYLKQCGSKNPSAHWYYIRSTLREKDPAAWEQLTKEDPKVDLTICSEELTEQEEPETVFAEVPEIPAVSEGLVQAANEELIRAARENVAEMEAHQKITRPVNYAGFDVSAVRDPDTGDEFYYDPKYGTLDWRSTVGEEVSMAPAMWRRLAENLPRVMEILGI